MTYELRPALWDDNPFLEVLYADVHGPELASLALPELALAQLVSLKFKAERMAFAAQFPNADHNIISVGEHRIGRILLNETPTQIQLVDLSLLTALRGAGVGTGILEQLQIHAAERGLPLRLSIHPQNPATRLFHRLGFVSVGDQASPLQFEWIATQSQ